MKLRAVIFAAFLLVGFAGTRSLIAYQAPAQPSPQQAAIAQALDQRGVGQVPDKPAPAVAPRRLRGARRSDPHKVLMAPRYRARAGIPTSYPPKINYKLDIWGNDTYGDCVSAEEAAKLSIYSVNAGFPGVFVDPQVQHQQMRVTIEHPVHGKLDVLGFPIKFTDDPCRVHRPPPVLGADTDAILSELGYSAHDIRALHDRHIA